MAETLTKAQRAAVENRGGPLLVAAAAGSGKTKVLVDRLMGYLCQAQDPANLDEFLIITYTRAAASELRGKIGARLTELLAQHPENRHLQRQVQRLYLAKISTVHAFCGELLREYAFALELPGDFRVADEPECQELRLRAMETVLEAAYGQIDASPALQAFVDTQGFGRDDRAVPEIVAAIYDAARCHLRPEDWLEGCLARQEGLHDAADTPWGRYLADRLLNYLEQQGALLRRAAALAQTQEDLGPKYGPVLQENLRQLEQLRACRTWEEIRANRIVDFGRLPPVRKPRDPDLADTVKALRKACWEGLKERQAPFALESRQLIGDLDRSYPALQGLVQLVRDFARAYRQEKDRRRVLDFGDLEHRTLELLLGRGMSGPTRAARETGRRFREIMVDEYQDTNEVQDCIFQALSQERGNCFLVGDVKQSIYRFRLADPGIFLEKYREFAPAEQAEPGQGRKILLSENFRSGGEILEAANHVFRCAMSPDVGGLEYGQEEALRQGVCHVPLPQPAVELHGIQLTPGPDGQGADQYETEARFVAERIEALLREPAMIRQADALRPVRPGDVVILLRSPGSSAGIYRRALEARGIPVAAGTGGSVLDTGEAEVLLALLRVLDNPLQDIPLEAVLASPVFRFTADHLGRMRAAHREGSLFEALTGAAEAGDRQAGACLALLDSLRQTARLETLTRLLEKIYAQTHMEAVFAAMEGGERRRKNLEFLYETAAAFEQGGRRDLSQFLAHLDSLARRGLQPEQTGGTPDAVQILSIHKSKGLEYPVVFLCNLSAAFNREELRANVLVDSQLGIGCSALDRENRLRYPTLAKRAIAQKLQAEHRSEELRVLYVAMTRAKDMLIMTYASRYLTRRLEAVARQVMPTGNVMLAQEADCLGHWVLMAAMTRTEAGAFFERAGRPEETVVGAYPWSIRFHERGPGADAAPVVQPVPSREPETPPDLGALLSFRYPYAAATGAPSKITATQLKGRELDEEAAERAAPAASVGPRRWRQPVFLSERPLDGREIGTATHLAMQYIRYEACTDAGRVEEELSRLESEGFLTARQVRAVNRAWIASFFQTELGRRLQTGIDVLREFKFSLLADGEMLQEELAGEKLLLQGVVDCCLTEGEGLTVLDFKTDRVRPGGEAAAAARYAVQVQTYGRALSRIFGRPVKALLLYFFQTGGLIRIPAEAGEEDG